MKLVIAQANLTLKGGAERVILKIAQHYGATVYTAEYKENNTFDEFKGIDIKTIGHGMFGRMMPYGRLAQGLDYGMGFYNFKVEEDYDVINAHISPSNWIRKHNDRVLWYCHTPLREVYDLYGYRMSLRNPIKKPVYAAGAKIVRRIDRNVTKDIEFIFANSRNTKGRISKYLNRDDARVLPGGVDYDKYRNRGDKKYFFYPSRISPNKRQDYAIEAFRIFRKNKKFSDYKLIILGDISKDRFYYEYYLRVMKLAAETGNVIVAKSVSEAELIDFYSKSTAVLYTPSNEDYGLVPLEAMASGKPIIAVNEGGPTETIIDGETGFLANSKEEMASKMALVAGNADMAERMGRNGIERVKKHYSWERFFKLFEAGLKKVRDSE
ncbi:glycosyltransferase [Candidatus Marsarchaeota archaeon]|nr:glycosyltransferase [Candidatus Marsarchaeota archaeon]MCL5092610.1 glycosyltransferase [Candidatus Marsarchaeota archaeon]